MSRDREIVVYNGGGVSLSLPSTVSTGARQKALIGLISEGKYEEALEIMDSKSRGNAELNHLLGQVALSRGEYDRSLVYLRRADFASPGNTNIRADIATVFYYLGKNTAAKMLLNQLLGDRYPPSQAYYVMGLIQYNGGDWSDAEKLFRKAISMNEQHGEANYELGALLLEDDRPEEAYFFCIRSLELLRDDAGAYNNAGQAALRLGRYALCEQHLRKSLSLNPNGVRSRFALGLCLIERGQEHEAMLLFRELLDIESRVYPDIVRAIAKAGRGGISINPLRIRQKLYASEI